MNTIHIHNNGSQSQIRNGETCCKRYFFVATALAATAFSILCAVARPNLEDISSRFSADMSPQSCLITIIGFLCGVPLLAAVSAVLFFGIDGLFRRR